MRVSTNQIFQRSLNAMLLKSAQVNRLQEQVSTGKRVQIASDDPVAASKILLLRQKNASATQSNKNCQAARASLNFEESVVGTAVQIMQNFRELQVKAGNTALSEDDRKSLAMEAEKLLEQFVDLSNTQDSEGGYIFSGSKTGIPAITRNSSGQYIYNGDETQRFQSIGGTSLLAMNDTAKAIFMEIATGNGDFTVKENIANTGTGFMTTGSVLNRNQVVVQNYSIDYVLNSNNEMVVLVTGSVSGNVIPPSGNPDDAPVYIEGMELNFNGIEVKNSGLPQVGDNFSIQPSTKDSVFSTVQSMISNLRKPFTNSTDKAHTATANNQLLSELDRSLKNILNTQSQIGSRLNQVELAEKVNEDLLATSTTLIEELENVDYLKAITDLTLQEFFLEAAQKSFTKIQGMSIFNYL